MDVIILAILLISAFGGAFKGPHRILGGWLGWILGLPLLSWLHPLAISLSWHQAEILFAVRYFWWPLGLFACSGLGSLLGQGMDRSLAQTHSRGAVMFLGAVLASGAGLIGIFLSLVILEPVLVRVPLQVVADSRFLGLASELRLTNPNLDRSLESFTGLRALSHKLDSMKGSGRDLQWIEN